MRVSILHTHRQTQAHMQQIAIKRGNSWGKVCGEITLNLSPKKICIKKENLAQAGDFICYLLYYSRYPADGDNAIVAESSDGASSPCTSYMESILFCNRRQSRRCGHL